MASTTYKKPKLPAQQLAILAVARFAEPIAMTSVYPYLPEMIASFGIGRKDVAKWAGVTSAVFSVSQSLTAVFWGQASDKYGRKPVILLGLLHTMVLFLIWGVSTNLTMAIIVRALQGACNGNVGIIRTMVAEMVPERELQPTAFSIMPLVWSIGSVFGPAFGGVLAKPAEQFPGLFGNSHFFNKYPFALPNIVGFFVFLISVGTAALFLKETLQSKKSSRDWGLVLGKRITEAFRDHPAQTHQRLRRYSLQDAEASTPLLQTAKAKKTSTKVEKPVAPDMTVFTRQTVITLIAYTFLALHSVAFDQVLPVFLNYDPEEHTGSNTSLPFFFSGGFGLESGRIGTIFALYGVICGGVQFILFPPVCKRFGVLRCFRFCSLTYPIIYFVTPYTVLIEDERTRYAALALVLIFKAFTVIVGFPCVTILLTNSASSLSVLGTLNGWATTFSALGRASGPALTGAAFSWGVKHNMVGAPWWILAFIALIGAIPVWMVEEGEGPSSCGGSGSGASTPGSSDSEDTRLGDEEEEGAVFFDDDDETEEPEEHERIPDGYEDQDLPLTPASRRGSRRSAGYGGTS